MEIEIVQIKHKLSICNCISGGLGDWHSSCLVYHYTTSGHTDLYSIYVPYIQYTIMYISKQYMYIFCTMYLFIYNAVTLWESNSYLCSFCYSSFR
jgi:hypothetical protein